MPSTRPAWRRAEVAGAAALAALVALAALIGATWWPALGAGFQFDDFNVIVADARVQSLAAWWQALPGIRPLLKLSYALNHAAGAGPRGFRLVNVAIHAANACLVATLLWRRARRHGLAAGTAMLATALATLVFALHPVQTEAVTYVSGRSVSLAALPCLLALACWLRAVDAGSAQVPRRRAARAWRGGALLAFAAALGVRETAVVLPLALLLWSATEPEASQARARGALPPLSPPPPLPPPARPDWRGLAPLFALALLALAVACLWPAYRRLLDTSLAIRPVGVNLMTQAHALGYLALQLLRPWGMNADPALPVTARLDLATALLGLAWLLLAAGGFAARRRHPALAFGLLWFLVWLAPTNSLLPRYDVANDRQLYLALVGPAWLLGCGLAAGGRRLALRAPASAVAAVARGGALLLPAALAAVLTTATLQRNRVYADEITFWEDVAARTPGNARAANNLGMAYAYACRDADAAAQFERAVRLQPAYHRARINLRLLRAGALFPDADAAGGVRADLPPRHCVWKATGGLPML
ncbi:MAG: hypothetical protein U1F06_01170 [Steroidobacteraceae bacterium]